MIATGCERAVTDRPDAARLLGTAGAPSGYRSSSRRSDLLRHIFERVVWAAMAMGLVKGEGFAVDASVLEAKRRLILRVLLRRINIEGQQILGHGSPLALRVGPVELIGRFAAVAAGRWFCKLDLEDKVPHHSTFSENRLGRFCDTMSIRIINSGSTEGRPMEL